MRTFEYLRAEDAATAVAEAARPETLFLAGGTTLLDLMKLNVERPARVVDITRLSGLDTIEVSADVIRIGALAKMSKVADHADIKEAAPVLSESLWRAASAQLRNMASIGGNLMQRTRCTYFRDPGAYSNCNKRNPGSGCAALEGVNRNHAVLGTSDACIAIYPGDFAVSLVAFDATVIVRGASERKIPVDEFFLLPGDTPHLEHELSPGEMIVAIEIPRSAALKRSHYLKVRDRASYEFAAASAAVGIEMEADGKTIRDVRIAVGGIATKPWRLRAVEDSLKGKTLDEATLRTAAAAAVDGAKSSGHNAFKIELAPKVVARALMTVGDIA
ncbi:xanthine dehydrogenase family protein subunit M [Mesorhizobium sp. B2-2-4]|uniref:FAD binding domain-containing protein n=1 Tax=unclassified Mesorhizobium TaxID=325217 RepID=UPI001126E68F|nr:MULTISPECIES: xanthine dehydrogenase family protein subunit M [unclassified Mesorhizobium]TPM57444.1 xanthine dehydrogenase family protein subunit M [Mesorhizobium sp. B2-2-4]TPM65752.1 xanthine dehydrogenase family protein subunit M [Mesorhizobium sp. B2-2-1]TPN72078.1 xanthine dehydrogenase family protein subunit M [Mesorhizobium sp. B1-1-3]